MTMRTNTNVATTRTPRESSIRADIRRRCLKARVEVMIAKRGGNGDNLPTHAEVVKAAKDWGDQFANVGRHTIRHDLLELERAEAIPRLPRADPSAGITWGKQIEAERKQAAFTINHHKARNTSRLPPGVPEGYAERACRRWARWTSEDEIVYRHWRASIPEVTAHLLFLDAPSPLLVARGAGWGEDEDGED